MCTLNTCPPTAVQFPVMPFIMTGPKTKEDDKDLKAALLNFEML